MEKNSDSDSDMSDIDEFVEKYKSIIHDDAKIAGIWYKHYHNNFSFILD